MSKAVPVAVGTVFLLSHLWSISALLCLSCPKVDDVRYCLTVEKCRSGQRCSTYRYTDGNGSLWYRLGCDDDISCDQSLLAGTLDKESYKNVTLVEADAVEMDNVDDQTNVTTSCHQCCNDTNGCNKNLCEAPLIMQRRCLVCKDVLDPDHCRQLTECGRDDQCFVEKERDPVTLDIRFQMKCLGNQQCRAIQSVSPTKCMACCNDTDLCNYDACDKWASTHVHTTEPDTSTLISTTVSSKSPTITTTNVPLTKSTLLTTSTAVPATKSTLPKTSTTHVPSTNSILSITATDAPLTSSTLSTTTDVPSTSSTLSTTTTDIPSTKSTFSSTAYVSRTKSSLPTTTTTAVPSTKPTLSTTKSTAEHSTKLTFPTTTTTEVPSTKSTLPTTTATAVYSTELNIPSSTSTAVPSSKPTLPTTTATDINLTKSTLPTTRTTDVHSTKSTLPSTTAKPTLQSTTSSTKSTLPSTVSTAAPSTKSTLPTTAAKSTVFTPTTNDHSSTELTLLSTSPNDVHSTNRTLSTTTIPVTNVIVTATTNKNSHTVPATSESSEKSVPTTTQNAQTFSATTAHSKRTVASTTALSKSTSSNTQAVPLTTLLQSTDTDAYTTEKSPPVSSLSTSPFITTTAASTAAETRSSTNTAFSSASTAFSTVPSGPDFQLVIDGSHSSSYMSHEELKCISIPSAEAYIWKFNGSFSLPHGVVQEKEIVVHGSLAGVDKLVISHLNESTFGTYTCLASINGHLVERGHFIGITKEKPAVSIIKPVISQNFALVCNVTGYPTPHIAWAFVHALKESTSVALPSDAIVSTKDNHSILLVPFYRPEIHDGTYFCAASNGFGTATGRVDVP